MRAWSAKEKFAMKRIAVLTSGGDAPGMNAAVRAAVRRARALGLEVLGIQYGLRGVLEGEPRPMDVADVGGILERGGTILMTSRYKPFLQPDVQRQAVDRLRGWGVDGLVVIGGEGSFHAAMRLHELGMPTVGVPATIDNDIYGTDMAIGVDTALNTIVQALDRLRDTATSHTRAFVVEVMGRHCGYLALLAGVAGGAEAVLIPEHSYDLNQLAARIVQGYERGKKHAIVLVAEGIRPKHAAQYVADHLSEATGVEVRVTVLGHVQRGGSPTAFDRLLASRLGAMAVESLQQGASCAMVALEADRVVLKSLGQVLSQRKALQPYLLQLAQVLSR